MATPTDHTDAAKLALAPYLTVAPTATTRGHLVSLLKDLHYLVGHDELVVALDLAWVKARADQHKDFEAHAKELGFWPPQPVPFTGVVGSDGKATITLA